jgi:CRISPR-associated protein Cmr2
MARYLVTLSLGPVQTMIGAARRTRDLWCGSWLLSEASRAAARALHEEHPGCLVFPAPERPDVDLKPLDRPGNEANVANVLRAEVDAEEGAVRTLCARARGAATARLIELGEAARRDLPGLREEVWQAQIGDLLEGYSAWVRLDGGDYGAASARLGGVLAARKATRDCAPAALTSGFGLPKSSLDGAFETVLPKDPAITARHRLGLSDGEQLDALGVIKRRGGDAEQFTAYSRIAADPWVERLTADQQRRLRDAYEPLVGLEIATRVSGNAGIYGALPYDAQLLFDFRLANALSGRKDKRPAQDALKALSGAIQAIAGERDRFGDPCAAPVPYAAILQADGDRMGELLSKATSAGQSRDISRALHLFANAVRELVREHRGHAIYAGGDDVLALLPLASAVDCARDLATEFARSLGEAAERIGVPADQRPTLSVGLGLGHLIEPLGSLRERARGAERLAKGDGLAVDQRRNALGVVLGIRSGGEIRWRARWDDATALKDLEDLSAAYRRGELPSRVAFDLRAIGQRMRDFGDDATGRGMRAAEVRRVLDRARVDGGSRSVSRELQGQILERADALPLAALADVLVIARWLAARTRDEVEDRR